jgi:hypothetical protein
MHVPSVRDYNAAEKLEQYTARAKPAAAVPISRNVQLVD